MDRVSVELRDKLGIAVAKRTYKAYRQLRFGSMAATGECGRPAAAAALG
jgi:hypothetical protein